MCPGTKITIDKCTYLGMPYVLTNSWNAYVYLLVVKWVGAVGQLSGTFSIIA